MLNGYGDSLAELRQQVADNIRRADDINELIPLNEVLKHYTVELNSAYKAFASYGDGLEKTEAKVLAKSIDDRATTWDRFKKTLSARVEEVVAKIKSSRAVIKEAKWLTEKFGEGKYTDVPGLCKIATITEIEEKNWSLTPGTYVGVAPMKADDVDFEDRIIEIHLDLLRLQTEANMLMETISSNFKRLTL